MAMAFGAQGQQGFNYPSEIFANILKLIGPNAEIIGPDFIINSNGFFFYSGTPAVGNLVASWTNTAPTGSDPEGNTTYPGFVVYQASAISELWQGVAQFFSPTDIPNNKAQIGIGAVGAATQELSLTSGNVSTDTPATMALISSTSAPEITFTLDFATVLSLLASGSVLSSNLNIVGHLVVTDDETGYAESVTQNGAGNIVEWIGPAGATAILALAILLSGDTNPRFTITPNGVISWGPGNAASDVSLERSSPGTLEVIGSLAISNSLQVLVNTILEGTQMSSLDMTAAGTNFSGNPLIADSWHSLGTFPTAGVSTVVGRYRLLPDGDVEIDIMLSTSAAVAAFSASFPNTLPAAYLPAQDKICAIGTVGTNWTISSSRLPNCLVTTAGAVQVNMPAIPGAEANIGCTFRYPVN